MERVGKIRLLLGAEPITPPARPVRHLADPRGPRYEAKLEVRRYEKRFLHGKAFIFEEGQGVIAGSSNFTAAGLVSNLELNLGQYQPAVTQQVERWFEELWAEAVPYDLAARTGSCTSRDSRQTVLTALDGSSIATAACSSRTPLAWERVS